MATLNEDLGHFVIEIVQAETNLDVRDIDRWVSKLMAILRRHPYDLMQLATVRKVHPNIDTLPAPKRADTATNTSYTVSDVMETRPNIRSRPTPEKGTGTPTVEFKDGTAANYFKDDPQGKGW